MRMTKFLAVLIALVIFNMTGCLWKSPDAEQRVKTSFGYNNGYAPEQPLPFSHELHVGTHNIQCQYCHNQV